MRKEVVQTKIVPWTVLGRPHILSQIVSMLQSIKKIFLKLNIFKNIK